MNFIEDTTRQGSQRLLNLDHVIEIDCFEKETSTDDDLKIKSCGED